MKVIFHYIKRKGCEHMIVKREKYFIKYFKKYSTDTFSTGSQQCKRTSYWLFGFIPLFIKTEVIKGDYERL
jgi:hypothetical protein